MILNDLSIAGQFEEDEFYEIIRTVIKPLFEKMSEKGVELLKRQDAYNRMVTPDKTMMQLISVTGNPIASKFKSLLINLSCVEPFLPENTGEEVYLKDIGKTYGGDTCIYEAIKRKDGLLSFPKSVFANFNKLACVIKSQEYSVDNISTKNDLTLCLLSKMKKSDFRETLSEWDYEGKSLTYMGTDCFELDMKKIAAQNFDDKDYEAVFRHLSDLENVILTQNVTRFSHPLIPEKKIYEYRLSLSNGNELRMTYRNASPAYFLTAFIKKSESTPQRERERAVKQLNCVGNRIL